MGFDARKEILIAIDRSNLILSRELQNFQVECLIDKLAFRDHEGVELRFSLILVCRLLFHRYSL